MKLQDVIRIRRNELGLTLEQIAQACGVGRSIVAKWERGEVSNIKRNNIKALADVLQVSPLVLLDREELKPIPPENQTLPAALSVPLIGRVACGQPITAEQNIEALVSIPAAWHASFTLLCEGDSMAPTIRDGDLVAIRSQPQVENGQIAAVRICDEATLKRVYLHPDYIELRPENPAYDSIIRRREEMNDVYIEGLAVGLCRGIRE